MRPPRWPPREEGHKRDHQGAARYIGQPVLRREDPRMLTGHGRYIADVALPGMRHAAFVRSEVAHGQVVHLDVEPARRHPGVHAVYTAADLNSVAGPMWGSLYEGAPGPPLRPLADRDVRFVGDPLAIVVADDRYVAEDACAMVEVDIDPRPAVLDIDDALESDHLVHPELGTNLAARVDTFDERGLREVCAAAATVVSRTFRQGRATNVPMEPRGLVVDWDPWVPELRVWSSTQNAHEVRAVCARLLRLPEHQVRACSGDVGGGFGMKIFLTPDEACVVLAAHRLQQPVQWIEDRRENLLAAGHARDDRATIDVALDDEGRLLGLRVDHLEDVGAFPVGGTASATGTVQRLLPGPYRVGQVFYSGRGRLHEHLWAHGLPGSVGDGDGRAGADARPRGSRGRSRPVGAASPQRHPAGRAAVHDGDRAPSSMPSRRPRPSNGPRR